MKSQIWKFDIPVQGPEPFAVLMPADAQVLDLQEQAGRFVMWALVSEAPKITERNFVLIMTGSPFLMKDMKYIKTIQDGPPVFHLFEVLS